MALANHGMHCFGLTTAWYDWTQSSLSARDGLSSERSACLIMIRRRLRLHWRCDRMKYSGRAVPKSSAWPSHSNSADHGHSRALSERVSCRRE
jgi:hypothetical protein